MHAPVIMAFVHICVVFAYLWVHRYAHACVCVDAHVCMCMQHVQMCVYMPM